MTETIHSLVPALFRKYGTLRRFSAGQQIFLKGADARDIYYLDQGKVRAYLLYPDGSERTLCFVERGHLVGEEAVGSPARRIVCVDAATDLILYSMSAQRLFEVFSQNGSSLPEILALFMKKIEVLSNWIFYAQFTQNSAKLACFLYSNSRENLQRISYTQEQIGNVTGMSRVSVSSWLKILEERHLIRRGYGVIYVLDRPALRQYFDNREF